MKQKKLLITTVVLLVGGFGILSSKLVAALEARAFKVNTVVSDDSVKFEVESKENLNQNVSIMIIDKDTKAIKYIDQGKLNGDKYTFSTALEEGNYEGSLNISDNGVIAINTFVVSKDQTEEIPPIEEDGQKPEAPQDPTNPSKPGSGSTNTETPGNGSTNTDKPNNGGNNNSSNNGNTGSTGNTGNSSTDSNNSQNQGNTTNNNEESDITESDKNTDNTENEIAKDENTKTEADSKEEVESNIVEVFEESTHLSVGYMVLVLIFAAGVGTVIYKNLNK